jgi:hypothetical protein
MKKEKIGDLYFKLIQLSNKCFVRIKIAYSRYEARKFRKEVISKKGKKVVNRQIKRSIKQYAKKRFGSKSYWPYLALYTEIRGRFIEGWLPHDYFRYVLMPQITTGLSFEMSKYKTFDYQIFDDFALKPLFVYISGMFLNADFDLFEEEQILRILYEYDATIVIKEDEGLQGLQVRMIHSSEFKTDTLIPSKSYVIQPYVKQYKPISDLYADSVNTFRITTFIRNDGSVEVKFVVLRFGVDGSKVDNLSIGGQYIYFDLDGKPSNNAYDIKGNDMGERHKNSGYRFADLKIPMFQELLKACISAHRKYPYVRLVSWDVCIDDSGKPVLLEWNAGNIGFSMFEYVFGPIFPEDDIV